MFLGIVGVVLTAGGQDRLGGSADGCGWVESKL